MRFGSLFLLLVILATTHCQSTRFDDDDPCKLDCKLIRLVIYKRVRDINNKKTATISPQFKLTNPPTNQEPTTTKPTSQVNSENGTVLPVKSGNRTTITPQFKLTNPPTNQEPPTTKPTSQVNSENGTVLPVKSGNVTTITPQFKLTNPPTNQEPTTTKPTLQVNSEKGAALPVKTTDGNTSTVTLTVVVPIPVPLVLPVPIPPIPIPVPVVVPVPPVPLTGVVPPPPPSPINGIQSAANNFGRNDKLESVVDTGETYIDTLKSPTSTPDTLQPEVNESQHTSINRDNEYVTSSDESHYQTQPSVSETQAPQQHKPASTQNLNWSGIFPLVPQHHNPFGYSQNPNLPGTFSLGPQQHNPFGYLRNPNWPQQNNPFGYSQNPNLPGTFSLGPQHHKPFGNPQNPNGPGTISVSVYNHGRVYVEPPIIHIIESQSIGYPQNQNVFAAPSQVAMG